MDNKFLITKELGKLLKSTDCYCDLNRMEYVRKDYGEEAVRVTFGSGYVKEINVSMDSGAALIRDVVNGLVNY